MTTDDATTTPDATPATTGPVTATAGSYYRRTRYIMFAVLVGAGLWFAYDGWKAWPEENRKHLEIAGQLEDATRKGEQDKAAQLAVDLKKYKLRDDFDIRLQRILAVALPPLGVALLAWALYNSRGRYHLDGTILSIPGHPTIDLDHVTKIDKQLWDRKGIAYIDYDTGSQTGTLRLDDFVYDAHPTREIFKRIESHTLARLQEPDATAPAATDDPIEPTA